MLQRLGLAREDVSTQVVPRDRHAELLSAVALAGAGLERFATEIRHLQRTEVREVEEPFRAGPEGLLVDAAQAQPDRAASASPASRGCCAATRRRASRTWRSGTSATSPTPPSSGSRCPDATILLDYAQHLAIRRGGRAWWCTPDRMRGQPRATHGALYSQRALLALVEAGRSRDDAYRIVQENAHCAFLTTGAHFRQLLAAAGARARPGRDLRSGSLRAPRPRPGRRAWTICPPRLGPWTPVPSPRHGLMGGPEASMARGWIPTPPAPPPGGSAVSERRSSAVVPLPSARLGSRASITPSRRTRAAAGASAARRAAGR